MILTKIEILSFLSANKEYMLKVFGITSISLFGSFARDEQTEDSDIDLLYEMNDPSFSKIAALKDYLETYFNRQIGLVRKRERLKPGFLKVISRDLIHVS